MPRKMIRITIGFLLGLELALFALSPFCIIEIDVHKYFLNTGPWGLYLGDRMSGVKYGCGATSFWSEFQWAYYFIRPEIGSDRTIIPWWLLLLTTSAGCLVGFRVTRVRPRGFPVGKARAQ